MTVTSHGLLGPADTLARLLGIDANHAWTAFGPTNVALHRVHVALAFGDAGTALQYARGIDGRRLAVPERRAGLYLDAAKALVQVGDHEGACRLLAAVERLAPEELISRASVWTLIDSIARGAPRSLQPTVRALAARAGTDL